MYPLEIDARTCAEWVCGTASQAEVAIKLYNHTSQLPPAWNLLLPAQSNLHTHKLQAIENSGVNAMGYYYVTLHQNNKLVGIMYFQHLTISNSFYPNFSSLGTGAKIIYNYLSKRTFGLVVGGHLFMTGFKSYWFDSTSIDTTNFFATYTRIAKKVQRHTGAFSLMLKDTDEALTNYLNLNNEGLVHSGEDIYMAMPISNRWDSCDDYCADLTRKYSARFKKMRAALQGLEIKQLTETQVVEQAAEIEKLYLEIINAADVKMGILNAQYFINLKQLMGNKLEVWGFYQNQTLVGVSIGIIENGSYEIYYVGYTALANKTYSLYPNMLLLGLERAIALKSKTLKLGRTALEAKAILGCQPQYLNNYVSFTNPIVKLGYRYLIKIFGTNRGEGWKNRNPFKEGIVL